MNTSQINALLTCDKRTRPYYLGCFPVDRLPERPKRSKFCFIFNNEAAGEAGEHWIACFSNNDTVEMFCTYGKSPRYYKVNLKRYGKRVVYNKQQIQHPFFQLCGLHCSLYLALRCEGVARKTILDAIYANNLKLNDYVALLYLSLHLKKHVHRYCSQ